MLAPTGDFLSVADEGDRPVRATLTRTPAGRLVVILSRLAESETRELSDAVIRSITFG